MLVSRGELRKYLEDLETKKWEFWKIGFRDLFEHKEILKRCRNEQTKFSKGLKIRNLKVLGNKCDKAWSFILFSKKVWIRKLQIRLGNEKRRKVEIGDLKILGNK